MGCYDDTPGVRLVIKDPGFGAAKVELFLGTRHKGMTGVAPNASRMTELRRKLQGDTYFLDGPNDGMTPITELPVVDGKVVWNLQAAGSSASDVKIVVAIAYDAQGTAIAMAKKVDVTVPANDAEAYVLTLEPATQLAPSAAMQPPGVRVWPWRKVGAPDTTACLGIERSDGAGQLERQWLVPEDDPDCDEVAVECDEFFWHADASIRDGGVEDANCFDGAPGPMNTTTACRLGARTCVDGSAPGTCFPLAQPQYCLADALCNPGACMADPAACTNVLPSTYVTCTAPTDGQGTPCSAAGNTRELFVDLEPLVPACRAVDFVAWDVLGGGVVPSPTHVDGSAMFTITSLDPTRCLFTIRPAGTIDNLFANKTFLIGLDVTLATDHLLIPLVVTSAKTVCGVEPMCGIVPGANEGLDRCQ